MTELLCQSASAGRGGSLWILSCPYAARHNLAGFHVCGHHQTYWKPKLERGEKIRIHPERTLPLDHTCHNALTPPRVPDRRVLFEAERDLTAYWRIHDPSRAPARAVPAEPEPKPETEPEDTEDQEFAEKQGGPVAYLYMHEVVCGHCGRKIGDVQTTNSSVAVSVPGVRCKHCGGPPMFSGDVSRRLLVERDLMRGFQPRVGRPPRALVEQRGAA